MTTMTELATRQLTLAKLRTAVEYMRIDRMDLFLSEVASAACILAPFMSAETRAVVAKAMGVLPFPAVPAPLAASALQAAGVTGALARIEDALFDGMAQG